MTFQEIITKLTELKLKFEPCYKLKAQDMDEIVDILLQLNSDNEYQQNIYSTDETIIGKYLGKTLYRKVIPHTFNGDYFFTITHNLDIDSYLTVDFISNTSDGNNPILPSKFKLTLIEYILKVEDGNGWLYDESPNVLSFGADGINSDGETGYIIIEYTKNEQLYI